MTFLEVSQVTRKTYICLVILEVSRVTRKTPTISKSYLVLLEVSRVTRKTPTISKSYLVLLEVSGLPKGSYRPREFITITRHIPMISANKPYSAKATNCKLSNHYHFQSEGGM